MGVSNAVTQIFVQTQDQITLIVPQSQPLLSHIPEVMTDEYTFPELYFSGGG